jgi:hypothetical protein
MAAIQWVTISVSNNFFICQRILPRLSVVFVFILLCTFLEVDLVGFFSCNVSGNFRILYVTDSRNVNNVVCVSASHAQSLRDHVHSWITFVTKTSPQDHATLSAFHALRLRFTICIPCLLNHSTCVVILRSVWTPEQASWLVYKNNL